LKLIVRATLATGNEVGRAAADARTVYAPLRAEVDV
jgi:hypothetical protein